MLAMSKVPAPGKAFLTDTLSGVLKRMNGKQRRGARSCFEHWTVQARSLATEDPLDAAYTIHCLTDELLQRMLAVSPNASQVQCRKGCAACCHLPVTIWPQEAQLLGSRVEKEGIPIDWVRVERQATKTADTWRELAPEDRACVFLAADRSCTVYEHRPTACRKYLVITDPDLCDTAKHPGALVGRLFSIEAEIMASACQTTLGVTTMAAALNEAMLASQATTTPPEPVEVAAGDPGASAGHSKNTHV